MTTSVADVEAVDVVAADEDEDGVDGDEVDAVDKVADEEVSVVEDETAVEEGAVSPTMRIVGEVSSGVRVTLWGVVGGEEVGRDGDNSFDAATLNEFPQLQHKLPLLGRSNLQKSLSRAFRRKSDSPFPE